MIAKFVLEELRSVANPEKAAFFQRYFKTGKGEYAEGDVFLGVEVPVVRNIVKENRGIALPEIQVLLYSEYHEARLSALLFLAQQFKKATEEKRKTIFDFYLAHARQASNWDLVDVTCRDIVGLYLLDKSDRSVLYRLAESENLWEQRIAIISTWTFVKYGDLTDTLELSKKLLNHKHDLMHKAVGWMLREAGKKDKKILVDFLEEYHERMSRTTLRYAIEHFPPEERAYFMKK
jgi:3-methyladenine DNA glycosylase AlkD